MARTKGAKAKKVEAPVEVPMARVEIPVGIVEIGGFGNEDTQRLVAKVNEIIRFINK